MLWNTHLCDNTSQKQVLNFFLSIIKIKDKSPTEAIRLEKANIFDEDLSHKLRRFRTNDHLTQQQVANALNIDRSTYSYYESGKTEPGFDILVKLSKIFGITLNDLAPQDDSGSEVNDSTSRGQHKAIPKKNVKREFLYNLTVDEQNVLLAYRLLDKRIQRYISNIIFDEKSKIDKDNK